MVMKEEIILMMIAYFSLILQGETKIELMYQMRLIIQIAHKIIKKFQMGGGYCLLNMSKTWSKDQKIQ